MAKFHIIDLERPPRIGRLIDTLFDHMPEIESDRAVLLTESYMQTEGEPIITRRAKAFANICEKLPVTIREEELVVGSATKSPRGCQVFPEYSFSWLEAEFDTVSTRAADPFYISEETKSTLRSVYRYWEGKTTSELATSYMAKETLLAMQHNIFTPGNYFYNGIGHLTVDYAKVLRIGYRGIIEEAEKERSKYGFAHPEYAARTHFLNAVILSCNAAITFAKRYSALALEKAASCSDPKRKKELLQIAANCARVPEYGASSFYEACQSFWFIQMLLQIESSGHSISPGRFDQYMYPYYRADLEAGKISPAFAQELMDCIWVKLNDLNKVRDAASAEGFAGYSLFQNLIAGGQTPDGVDATNDLSFMCIQATRHVLLPMPSFSVRVWNGTPHEFLLKAAELTRTGIGLPAYYNDEVIIPALLNRGLSMEDARDYNIIGCVEPQKAGKTDGWHDAAFFNMCRPLELVMNSGCDRSGTECDGTQIGPKTPPVTSMKTFEEFFDAYKTQTEYMLTLLVNADNSIDMAHAERCPLPFQSCMVEDCIGRGKSLQNGGAVYNFTGPQGFGIANMTDALYAIKTLVFEQKVMTMAELKEAVDHNFGEDIPDRSAQELTAKEMRRLADSGKAVTESLIKDTFRRLKCAGNTSDFQRAKYRRIRERIDSVPKYGNDISEVDDFAREVAYTYSRPLEKFKNPRGGQYQAGLYPVSANVPLGAQTGATPDGRLAFTPIADGVSPTAGKDTNGPTASCNSVSHLDHGIASNGTLFNMKFHPSALEGSTGLESFIALIRGFFDQKGSHVQFNVVSRETLLDAQQHPEKYKSLVVRVAGYSALFTTLSKPLQDDIINRTEQASF